MARLPGPEELGYVQAPEERPIGRIDATPLGRGQEELGAGLQKLGTSLSEFEERKDKYEFSLAHAGVAADLAAVHSDLADDNTYTDESGKILPNRYADRVQAVYDKWAPTVSNPAVRDRFTETVAPEIAASVAKAGARGRALFADQAEADELARRTTLINNAATSGDEDTKRIALDGIHSGINALAESTGMPPTKVLARKQQAAQQFAIADYLGAVNSGDDARIRGALDRLRVPPGAPDSYTARVWQIESGNDPNAVTGKNRGLGQFGPEEEARYGINDSNRTSPAVQARALQLETGENAPALAKATGRNPTGADLYLAHQQGQAGAVALLSNPSQPAWQAIRKYYPSDAVAKQAITGNIPSDSPLKGQPVDEVTAQAFSSMWKDKFERGAGSSSVDVPTMGTEHLYDLLHLSPDLRQRLIGEGEAALADHRNRRDAAAKLDEYNLKGAIKDDLASVEATGRGLDSVPADRIRAVLGDAALQKYKDDRNDRQNLWLATHDFPTLPEPEMQARIDAIEPQPGAPGYERAQKVWSDAKDKRDDVLKARRDDPAGSITDDPAVKDALAQYDPHNPATFKAVAQARMAAQDRAGLDEEYRSPITKQEALKLTEPLRTMLPGQERDTLTNIGEKFQQMFGEDAETAFSYALRAHKVDAATAQLAARVARKLQLGAIPTTGEAQTLDDAKDLDAAQRAVSGGPTWYDRMLSGVGNWLGAGAAMEREATGAAVGVAPEQSGAAAAGPQLPAIKPRAMEYLLAHPDTAGAFDREFGRPGLAKQILEKYSAAAGKPTVRDMPAPLPAAPPAAPSSPLPYSEPAAIRPPQYSRETPPAIAPRPYEAPAPAPASLQSPTREAGQPSEMPRQPQEAPSVAQPGAAEPAPARQTPTAAPATRAGLEPAASRAAKAVDIAAAHVGEHEETDNATLKSFFKANGFNIDPKSDAWCAAFISSSLKAAGQTPPDRPLSANAYKNWGKPIATDVRPGDVLVRNYSPKKGEPGFGYGHAALATGRVDYNGTEYDSIDALKAVIGQHIERDSLYYESITGDHDEGNGPVVAKAWYPATGFDLRRGGGA